MPYEEKILRRARERYEADKETRRIRFAQRREEIFRSQPRLREVDARLRTTAGRILSAALRRDADPAPAIQSLKEENLSLQAEKKQLLSQMRLPENCLDDTPICTACGGNGYLDGRICPHCLLMYCAQEQQKELSHMLDMGNQSFETFSLDWYSRRYDSRQGMSPRENMEQVLVYCQDYARYFTTDSGNLLLFGAPGLGKTFLSAAMAKEIIAKGFSVVYDTAGQIFKRLEERRFRRGEESDSVEQIFRCDLLILDDLGTEMTTAFVQSALYEIINTRLVGHAPVILNSNMGPGAIAKRYSAQIASRLEGEYKILSFFGDDIRQLKKAAQDRQL